MAYKSFGAIGNYIHVSSINYNKYGTNWSQNGEDGYRGDAAKIALFNKIIEERRTHQEPILNEEEKETVEFALSSLIGVNMDTMSGSLADQFWTYMKEKLNIDFTTSVEEILKNIDIKNAVKKYSLKKVGENHYAGSVRISTIITRIGQINEQIQELKTKGKAEGSPTTIAKLQGHLKHIYTGLNEIYDLALNVKDPDAFYSVEELVKKVQGSDVKKKLLDYNSLGKGSSKIVYGILNEINQTAQVAQGISNFKKGILFEYFCAYALAKTDDLAKKGVKTVLDKMVSGSKKSPVQVYLKNFNMEPSEFKDMFDTKAWKVSDQLASTIKETYDKVDLQLDFNGKPIKATLKNLNMFDVTTYPNINLVSKANIEALLQSMDITFVNHYLNAIASHRRYPHSEVPGFLNAEVVNMAKLAMKVNLLIAAWEGHKANADKANLLILNNNKAGDNYKKILVINLSEIYNAFLANLEAVKTAQLIQAQPDIDSDSFFLQNTYADTYQQRINNILASIHSWKISIVFPKSFFSDYFTQKV